MKNLILILVLLIGINSANAQLQGQARIDSLLQELPKEKNDTTKMMILQLLSYEYLSINPDEGINCGEQALQIAKKLKYKKGIASSLSYLGVCNDVKTNYVQSLEYYYKALKLFEELGNPNNIATAYSYIGSSYKNQSDYKNALKYYLKALNIFETLDNKRSYAIVLGNIGIIYREQSNYVKAKENFLKALKICEEINDRGYLAQNLQYLGGLYNIQAEYGLALEYNFKSLKIFEELGVKRGIAFTKASIGSAYLKISVDTVFLNIDKNHKLIKKTKEMNSKEGYDYLFQSMIICKEIGALDQLATIYNNLYEYYKGKKNYSKALENLELYKSTQDSVFNLEKATKFANLEAKRETQLKEKEIEVLNKEKQKQEVIKNFLIILSIIAIFITLLILFFYRRKKKDNSLLEEKNNQINNANIELEQLNDELVEHEIELERYSNHLESIVAERTQELVVAMKEIEKSSKLKTEIIANMNHEIRTPLSFIKSAAALIRLSVPKDSPDSEVIEFIISLDEGVNRLTRTLELFTDLSEIKSGNYKTNISGCNVKSILDHFYLMYGKLIYELQKPIEINLTCQVDEAYIKADEQNIQKTIEFIIDNAVKFTDSGHVDVSLLLTEDSKYQLIIEDTGIGIADEYKEKIFEPFSQEDMSATRAYEGIGLSLALAYEYALLNNFQMSFESKKGKGTKFVLEFDKYNFDEIE